MAVPRTARVACVERTRLVVTIAATVNELIAITATRSGQEETIAVIGGEDLKTRQILIGGIGVSHYKSTMVYN